MPPLPHGKRDAIASLACATYKKVWLEFAPEEVFWDHHAPLIVCAHHAAQPQQPQQPQQGAWAEGGNYTKAHSRHAAEDAEKEAAHPAIYNASSPECQKCGGDRPEACR